MCILIRLAKTPNLGGVTLLTFHWKVTPTKAKLLPSYMDDVWMQYGYGMDTVWEYYETRIFAVFLSPFEL